MSVMCIGDEEFINQSELCPQVVQTYYRKLYTDPALEYAATEALGRVISGHLEENHSEHVVDAKSDIMYPIMDPHDFSQSEGEVSEDQEKEALMAGQLEKAADEGKGGDDEAGKELVDEVEEGGCLVGDIAPLEQERGVEALTLEGAESCVRKEDEKEEGGGQYGRELQREHEIGNDEQNWEEDGEVGEIAEQDCGWEEEGEIVEEVVAAIDVTDALLREAAIDMVAAHHLNNLDGADNFAGEWEEEEEEDDVEMMMQLLMAGADGGGEHGVEMTTRLLMEEEDAGRGEQKDVGREGCGSDGDAGHEADSTGVVARIVAAVHVNQGVQMGVHIEEGLKRMGRITQPIALPVRPGVMNCSFFMRTGICKFGRVCKWNHPQQTATYRNTLQHTAMPVRQSQEDQTKYVTSKKEGLLEKLRGDEKLRCSKCGHDFWFTGEREERGQTQCGFVWVGGGCECVCSRVLSDNRLRCSTYGHDFWFTGEKECVCVRER